MGEGTPDRTRNELSGRADVAVQAGVVHGGVHITQHAAPATVPRQLIPRPHNFVNQRRVLAELATVLTADQDRNAPPRIAVLHGVGGVGKSAAALETLHRHADGFPDGQLYADLSASHDPDSPDPDSPEAAGPDTDSPHRLATSVDGVLVDFLLALGERRDGLPASTAARSALLRSRTHGRRMQILLENAVSADQIRPLLPGAGGSAVVVTARADLSELWVQHGARLIELAPLEDAAASELLTRLVGADRVAAEPAAVASLLAVCGGLPIALCVVAALAVARPRRPLARLAAELADERGRLARLAAGGRLSVTAVFAVCYRSLSPQAAAMYQAMGAHPGHGAVGVAALAAMLRVPADEAREVVAELASARLVDEVADDRYLMHDLVRLHARDVWMAGCDPERRREAVADLLDHYLRLAIRCDLALLPGRGDWVGPGYQRADGDQPLTEAEARATLEAERANLRAMVAAAHAEGDDDRCWQLCEALWSLYFFGKYFEDWQATHELGLDAAIRCGNLAAQARVGVQLGFCHHLRGDYQQAADVFAAALDPARRAGSPPAHATAVESLGLARLLGGEPEAARDMLARNLALAERIGYPRRLGLAHHHLGRALSACGEHDAALDHLAAALGVLRELPDPANPGGVRADRYNVGRVLTSTGVALIAAGHPDPADAPLREALEIMTERGDAFQMTDIQLALADRADALGAPAEARAWRQQALELAEARHLPQLARIRAALADADAS